MNMKGMHTPKILIFAVFDGHFESTLFQSLGDGFRQLGKDVVFVDAAVGRNAMLRLIEDTDIDFSIGSNAAGAAWAVDCQPIAQFFKHHQHIALLGDAPYNISISNVRNIDIDNLIIGFRDRTHLLFHTRYSSNNKVISRFFHPFKALTTHISDNSDRPYDLVFSGNYYGESSRWWKAMNYNKILIQILDESADILENEPVTVVMALNYILKKYHLDISELNIDPYYIHTVLYTYAKCFRRNRLIEFISQSNLNLIVTSASWKGSKYSKYLKFQIINNTNDILNVYKRTKIVLSDMAEFNDGSHCRIADATLCGSAIVSEYSRYLSENFKGDEIFCFSWNKLGLLPKLLEHLLASKKLRCACIEKARRKILDAHMPLHSAQSVLEKISNIRQNKINT